MFTMAVMFVVGRYFLQRDCKQKKRPYRKFYRRIASAELFVYNTIRVWDDVNFLFDEY